MYAYTIITLNGRSFTFIADEVKEFGGDYLFSENGDVVATFSKTAITGYFRSEVIDDDEEYDD